METEHTKKEHNKINVSSETTTYTEGTSLSTVSGDISSSHAKDRLGAAGSITGRKESIEHSGKRTASKDLL